MPLLKQKPKGFFSDAVLQSPMQWRESVFIFPLLKVFWDTFLNCCNNEKEIQNKFAYLCCSEHISHDCVGSAYEMWNLYTDVTCWHLWESWYRVIFIPSNLIMLRQVLTQSVVHKMRAPIHYLSNIVMIPRVFTTAKCLPQLQQDPQAKNVQNIGDPLIKQWPICSWGVRGRFLTLINTILRCYGSSYLGRVQCFASLSKC